MAPEQCDPVAHSGQIGPAADIWGLGATLYHATTGEVPFPRESGGRKSSDPTVRFPQLVTRPAALPKGVPEAFRELVMTMFSEDRAARPVASQVAAALDPLVSALPRKMRFGGAIGRR